MSPVEPNGIPTGPAGPLVPGTPNGDVVPIPGITVCAKLGPQPSQAVAAAIAKKRFIETSIQPGRLSTSGNVDIRIHLFASSMKQGVETAEAGRRDPMRRPKNIGPPCFDCLIPIVPIIVQLPHSLAGANCTSASAADL
jgi:hypothetical protein